MLHGLRSELFFAKLAVPWKMIARVRQFDTEDHWHTERLKDAVII